MTDQNRETRPCPRCGATVASDAPEGLCPRCLLALTFATETEIAGEPLPAAPSQAARSASPPTPSTAEIARCFPQLEILECLGRGGMGAVYKVRQPRLDRLVALKVLLRSRETGGDDAAFAERFSREARALARLNHPSIVAVHEYGAAGGYPFLIMEYVDGLTLRQLLQRGKLKPEEALAIVPKICEALQFAHRNGIVHRDIKPENILLDKTGQVKITDFGIAKIIAPETPAQALTGAKEVVGTPHYMAPEQVERPQAVDHRADIYSLGVVFYEMLTGELPLGKFQPPSNKVRLDVRLDEVVLRALAKEPERRYQQVTEVKTDLETIAGSPSSQPNPPAAPPAPPPGQPALAVPGVARDLLPTPTSAPNRPPPQVSRVAVFGALWALLFAVNWVWSYTPPGWRLTAALRETLGHFATGLVQGPLAIIAFAAPVGMTGLGWVAVNGIRRSQGRLGGLALALADVVLFPLLLLDFWLVWLCHRVGAALTHASPRGVAGAIVLGVILALALDGVLIAWLWRHIRQPLPPRPNSPDVVEEAAERSWGQWLRKTLPRAALIGVVQLGLLETILQASVHRPESTGELWFIALSASSLAGMVWAAWPLRRGRLPALAALGGTGVLFAALCGADAFYSLRLRPNLGLYEEDDWVAQHPGFQWGWRQGTATALWHKPSAGPFAPAEERVLPLDDQQPAAFLDLDTGRHLGRESFDPDDEEALAWARAEKLDLGLVLKRNKVMALSLGLGVGWVPHFVPRQELTPQAAVNFWALDRKPAKEWSTLPMPTNLLATFVFRTREGGIGLLELGGWSDRPRGVKVRTKLVLQASLAAKP